MLKNIYFDDKPTDGGSPSSSEQDVSQESSSTSQETQDAPATEDVPSTSEDNTEAPSGPDDGTPGSQPNTEEQQATEENLLTDKPEDANLPFHKNPRFQELIKAKNDALAEATNLKSHAERAQILDTFLSSNGISPQDFATALDYLRLKRLDPVQALQLMRPDLDQLQMLTGEKLPADLESKVAAGMDVETAKELARLRVQSQRTQSQTQDYQAMQMQQHESMVQSAFNSFDTMKRGLDPDFKPKGDPRDPTYSTKPNGLWELTSLEIMRLRSERPPRTTQEALRLANEAYESAKRTVAQFAPKKAPVKRGVGSQNSSTNSNPVVKTPTDVVKAILAGKRPHELRYS